MARDVKHAARFVHAICVIFALAQGCARPSPPLVDSSPNEGRSSLVAAYANDPAPGVRARVVCKIEDVSPARWSDVVIHGEATIESCELVARAECDGHGDIVRACSPEPLPPALVPRGVFVMRHEMPESVRYETFATRDECESAKRERPITDESRAWLEAQINVETRDLAEAKAAVKTAERTLAEARAAQKPDVPLIQLEVEERRRKRDLSEKLLAALREQRQGQATPQKDSLACLPAGGS